MADEAPEYGEFDTDKHPGTSKFAWIWISPGGGEYRGQYEHKTAKLAVEAGRKWLSEQQIYYPQTH
jgi:hypothetical protein